MDERAKEFLSKLADLLREYDAEIYYTFNDDGMHVDLEGREIYVGWFEDLKVESVDR